MDKNPNTNESILELDAAEMQHVSGGDGFLSYVVIDPERRIGVFVAFNNMSGHRLEGVADAADALTAELGAGSSATR